MHDVDKRDEAAQTAAEAERSPSWFGFDWKDFLTPLTTAFEPMRIEEVDEETAHVVRAELPGVDPDSGIEVKVEGDHLVIEATREQKASETDGGRYRSEFRYGTLRRSMLLPSGVDPEVVSAEYRDGILEVRIPLAERPAPVAKIQITRSRQ